MTQQYMEVGERTEGGASVLIEGYWHDSLAGEAIDVNQIRVIRRLRTEAPKRRKGDATYLMARVVVEADKTGTVLLLDAIPDADCPIDADALRLFYLKFGFRMLDETHSPTTMVREPRRLPSHTVQ